VPAGDSLAFVKQLTQLYKVSWTHWCRPTALMNSQVKTECGRNFVGSADTEEKLDLVIFFYITKNNVCGHLCEIRSRLLAVGSLVYRRRLHGLSDWCLSD